MFITFTQNNSGGYFIQNDDVDSYVIIEGNNVEEILDKAREVFRDYREYCSCCGERWDDDYKDEDDLTDKPMIYDKSVYEYEGYYFRKRAIIHRIDGIKEVVDLK